MENNRGISPITALIILILLTIAAAIGAIYVVDTYSQQDLDLPDSPTKIINGIKSLFTQVKTGGIKATILVNENQVQGNPTLYNVSITAETMEKSDSITIHGPNGATTKLTTVGEKTTYLNVQVNTKIQVTAEKNGASRKIKTIQVDGNNQT